MARWLSLTLLFVLLASCAAQERRTIDPSWAATIIGTVLNRAHTSGSLAYRGRCGSNGGTLDLPRLRFPSDKKAPPFQMLREMFADDPRMQVTQEPNGIIRMMESDVLRDLLDFKIVYISFDTKPDQIDSPTMALWVILGDPEVKAFMMVKKIGPTLPEMFPFSVPGSDANISGDLYNVTVSQALDYVLKTYPGFWAYETCPNGNTGRTVYFSFFPTVPPGVANFP